MKRFALTLLFCCIALTAFAAEGLQLPAYNAKAFCEKKAKIGFAKECLQEEEAAYNRLISGIQTTADIFEKCRVALDALEFESYSAFEHCLKKGDADNPRP